MCHPWSWEQKQLIPCTEKSGLERKGTKEKGGEERVGEEENVEEVIR